MLLARGCDDLDTGKILVSGGVVQANTFTQYYLTELSSLASKNIVKMASRGGAFHALFLTGNPQSINLITKMTEKFTHLVIIVVDHWE